MGVRFSMSRNNVVLVELSPSGGLFQYAYEMGTALAARGEQVELWTGPDPELQSNQPGFTVRGVLPTWHPADAEPHSKLFRLARRLFRAGQLVFAWVVLSVRLLIARPRVVVWSQWRFFFEPAFAAALSVLLPATVFGIIAHEPVPRSDAKDTSTPKSGKLITRSFRAAWQRLDVAFVLGPRTRDLAVSYWQPRCPVLVIPHGSEPGVREPDTVVKPVGETDPVVLFFGVWSKYKGIEVLMDAFAGIRAAMPEARLVLAGAPGGDIDLAAILEQARRIGNVDARPGYVAMEEVAPLLNSARVVATPYIRATQSGVAHLAFTFGRPVVASAIGDLPEVIQNGVTGLLVPSGDAEALATAILRLLSDPVLAAKLGEAGENSVRDASAVAAERVSAALADAERANAGRSSGARH
jgi:glycosyltransferase involved in cell wall biosynthesis